MSENKRAGRNIKITVTDDISHMDITEQEYNIIETHVDPELNEKDVSLTPKEEDFVVKESKQNGLEPNVLRRILEKYKKEHGKAI